MQVQHKKNDIIQDRYRLVQVLGRGGSGITYRAEDTWAKQWVAVKVVSLRQMQDWKVLDLLEREAQTLKSLDHPAIPKYLDSFQIDSEDNRAFYLVQQLVPGRSLDSLIEQGWRPDEAEAQQIAQQVLEVLSYLQSLTPPIIHRDIKPQNLLYKSMPDGSKQLSLVDFGSVQDTYRHTVTGGSTVVGTFGYMAPEQFRGQADLTTDLYGLGATLLFLLTRDDPAHLPEKNFRLDFRSQAARMGNEVSDFFGDWLDCLIAPDTDSRFGAAQDALVSLVDQAALPQQRGDRKLIQHRRIRLERSSQQLSLAIAKAGLSDIRIRVQGLVALSYCFLTTLLVTIFLLNPYLLRYGGNWKLGLSLTAMGLGWMTLVGLVYCAEQKVQLDITADSFRLKRHRTAKEKPQSLQGIRRWMLRLPLFGTLLTDLVFVFNSRSHHAGFFLSAKEQQIVIREVQDFVRQQITHA